MAKSLKRDRKRVAAEQPYEVDFIHNTYKIPKAAIKAAIKKAGNMRKNIYAELRLQGYTIDTKNKK